MYVYTQGSRLPKVVSHRAISARGSTVESKSQCDHTYETYSQVYDLFLRIISQRKKL